MLKHLKYYKDLYRHKFAEDTVYDRMGKATVGTATVVAIFGAVAGFHLADGLDNVADQDAAANATEIIEQLSEQSQALQQQQAEFEALSDRITQESRAGGDITALEAEQTEASAALETFAQQLVANTLLSDELSEQQRQDFLTELDKNVVDMSSIGFEALDGGDDVDPLTHLREYMDSEKDGQGYSNNIERAQAMAAFNDEHNVQGDPLIGGTLGFLGGFLMVLFYSMGGRDRARKYAYDRPEKPSRHHGFRH